MVGIRDIRAANELITDATAPSVAVFVGGTSGIGQLTIKALVATGARVRIYLVGRRSSEDRSKTFIEGMHIVNPKAEIIWTEAEVSLLSETKRVCEAIKTKEPHLDLLFLTTGYAPFCKRQETSEGIEESLSLSYYTRILFIMHLLPLLRKADAPRVVAVLGGGLERLNSLQLDDLELKKPENWSGMKAQSQNTTINTVAMDKLAGDNPEVTFIHSWPGWVDTGNVKRGQENGSLISWVFRLLVEPLVATVSFRLEDSGQRHLFQCTSALYGGRGIPWSGKPGINVNLEPGVGLFLVSPWGDCTPNEKNIVQLRGKATGRVWEYTQEVLSPYL
jgi:NAD(P)-dependent dehydrogenase (short-subunit alcohol dehydrogenase family)